MAQAETVPSYGSSEAFLLLATAFCPSAPPDLARMHSRWHVVQLSLERALEGTEERAVVPEALMGAHGIREDPFDRLCPKDAAAAGEALPYAYAPNRVLRLVLAVQQLNAIDYCPTLVVFIQLLIRHADDATCFAILEHLLDRDRRQRVFGPLLGGPESLAALHATYEECLEKITPKTVAAMRDGSSKGSGAPSVLSAFSAAVAPGFLVVLLPKRSSLLGVVLGFLREGWKGLLKLGAAYLRILKKDIKFGPAQAEVSGEQGKGKLQRLVAMFRRLPTAAAAEGGAPEGASHEAAAAMLVVRLGGMAELRAGLLTAESLQASAAMTRDFRGRFVGLVPRAQLEASIAATVAAGAAPLEARMESWAQSAAVLSRLGLMVSLASREVEGPETTPLAFDDATEDTKARRLELAQQAVVMPPPATGEVSGGCGAAPGGTAVTAATGANYTQPLLDEGGEGNIAAPRVETPAEAAAAALASLPEVLLAPPSDRLALATWLPPRLRHRRLHLAFATATDGYHLPTLRARAKGSDAAVLVVRTSGRDRRFGCCLVDCDMSSDLTSDCGPESFLFALADNAGAPGRHFGCSGSTGEGLVIISPGRFFGIGPAADGDGFGLLLFDDLQSGSSVASAAFGSAMLHREGGAPAEGSSAQDFSVSAVELYTLK